MPRRDVKTEREIREAIEDYVKSYGPDSTSTIANYVESQLGVKPAKDTVADVLRSMGYVPLASQWVKG